MSSLRFPSPVSSLTQILLNYLSMLYPLIPMTVEEAWVHIPASLKREDAVYKLGWFQPSKQWLRASLAERMALFDTLNESVLQASEQARKQGYFSVPPPGFAKLRLTQRLIGNSLDADLLIWTQEHGDYNQFLSSNSTSPHWL